MVVGIVVAGAAFGLAVSVVLVVVVLVSSSSWSSSPSSSCSMGFAVFIVFVFIVFVAILVVFIVLVGIVVLDIGNVDGELPDDVLAQHDEGRSHAGFEGHPVPLDIDDMPDDPAGGEHLVADFPLADQLAGGPLLLALGAEDQEVERRRRSPPGSTAWCHRTNLTSWVRRRRRPGASTAPQVRPSSSDQKVGVGAHSGQTVAQPALTPRPPGYAQTSAISVRSWENRPWAMAVRARDIRSST